MCEWPFFTERCLQKMHGLQQGVECSWRGEINCQQNGPQMALELMGQGIDVVPVKGGFVEAGVRGDLVGDAVHLPTLQNRKSSGLDGLEGNVFPDAAVGEELQHLPCFLHVLIALDLVRIHPVLGDAPRLIDITPDVVDEAVEQIVVQPLIAVVDKAEQVDLNDLLLQLLQPEDGVVGHQRGVVLDALIGDVQVGQHPLGQVIQGADLLATLDFPFDFTEAEIFGLALEQRDLIQPLWIVHQTHKSLATRRFQMRAYDGNQPVLLMRHRLADGILQEAVSGRNDALLGQVLHEFTKDIDRFAGDLGRLPGFGLQLLSFLGSAESILAEFKDQTSLLVPCDLRDLKLGKLEVRKILSLNVSGILFDLVEIKGEKQLLGFEVTQLQKPVNARFDRVKLPQCVFFGV